MVMLTPEPEVEFRRRWYQAHLRRFEQDAEGVEWQRRVQGGLQDASAEGIAIRNTLRTTGNLEHFVKAMQVWSSHKAEPFNGFAGQMFINQLVKHTGDPGGMTEILSDVLWPPSEDAEGLEKIRRLVAAVEKIKKGAYPAPGFVPFCLSFFWSLSDRTRWPVFWQSAVRFVEFSTGQPLPKAPVDRYAAYVDLVRQLDDDYERYERVAAWWDDRKPVFVDEVLVDRCKFGMDVADEEDLAKRRSDLLVNTQALMGVAKHIGDSLKGELSAFLGRELKVVKPNRSWRPGRPRADMLIDFHSQEPGLRLWINHLGMAICLNPGIGPREKYGGKGTEKRWYNRTAEAANRLGKEDFELMSVGGSNYGRNLGFFGRAGSLVFGRWYDSEQLQGLDLRSEFRETVPQLRPVLEEWLRLYHNGSSPLTRPFPPPPDPLEELADELLVEVEVLKEIVGLLEDKGQVILYGPPGTGKTYLAKKLAEALTLDPETLQSDRDRLSFVQFHPSMSYEDFFEGYRPVETSSGAMTYHLTAGPLRAIAERAAQASERHVMIIDEINRANLPRVLGELLFLLEYRDEKVIPLYRPREPFALPPNLWIIGTMNTADRSIALVDAALRRRFHFVPFFPNHGPMEGLLDRWLEANEEDAWVGEMVALVNDELTEALGGPHLQLGASHFMKQGISSDRTGKLEMVWKYTIEPFIEEQFFDDPQQIKHFRLDQVRRRYQAQLGRPEDEEVD